MSDNSMVGLSLYDRFETTEYSIEEKGGRNLFHQRVSDGYINATELCNSVNKKFAGWNRLDSTQEFLQHLSSDMHINTSDLVHIIKGGDPRFQGTWVHPQVAINLAQWLSPKFAVQVSKWVLDWMSGKLPVVSNLPYHLQRYMANKHKIPHGYFSMLNEIAIDLIAPMEKQGYNLPENMIPDISQGRMFSDWLRKVKKVDPKTFPTYQHEYEDGRTYPARLYPNKLLIDFKEHFHNVWIQTKAIKYFEKRDIKALPFLQKAILLIDSTKIKPHKIKYIQNTEESKIIETIQNDNLEFNNNDNFEEKLEKIILPQKRT